MPEANKNYEPIPNMKLVATANFLHTNSEIKLAFDKPQKNPRHVAKGARFSIGGDLPFEKLSPRESIYVTLLNREGRILSPEQTELVARVDAEVENDKNVDARHDAFFAKHK